MSEIGKIIKHHQGCLCDCKEPEHQHNMCDRCGATFTMKSYANPGDDFTGECPICRVSEDPRKTGLKNGLRQLNIEQLQRVIDYPGEMVLDSYNYQDGKFCALAIALQLDQTIVDPSHDAVYQALTNMGYKVYNTRNIAGEYYTNNRLKDLLEAANEVLLEKQNAKQQ